MVACAALATHPPISLEVPMTSCALTVEQLKHHLLAAIENVSERQICYQIGASVAYSHWSGEREKRVERNHRDYLLGKTSSVDVIVFQGKSEIACDVLSELEKSSITKEILESTRIGATVNEVRKKTADVFPVVSKRCRALIKTWQKLVEVRPTSSTTSSANGTPNLVSPSVARLSRKVTPCTPINRRVSSTGFGGIGSAASSATVSPANGSYAPKQLSSPSNGVIHKSQSVGAELVYRGEDLRSGKRKLDDGNLNVNTSSGLKRTKTIVGSLASPVAPTVSVLAARKAVQSTKDLVAELSQNLPEHMSIDSSIREHEERVKREQQDEEVVRNAIVWRSIYKYPIFSTGKKKTEIRKEIEDARDVSVSSNSCRLIIRLPRVAPVKEESDGEMGHNSSMPNTTSRLETSSVGDSKSQSSGKVDWLAMLPSLEELEAKVSAMKASDESRKQAQHPTKAYLIRVRDRHVLALPYLDVPTVPDFIRYRYPNPAQYYAEENFIYGAPRD
ncbi:transcription elongation factor S-II protein [Dictyocaulus viviparus]|uniref:Mediator of RNA polymerase II transcription subunit 26 n=1 Tax=Dictyocaulus viviparus TaxID=29172 RepID=A0A0D8XXX7_DICVI|nr:transcription elongation factor S-II protein [Dictyocaulus viviparus]